MLRNLCESPRMGELYVCGLGSNDVFENFRHKILNGKQSRKAKAPHNAIPVHISILGCLGLNFFIRNPSISFSMSWFSLTV